MTVQKDSKKVAPWFLALAAAGLSLLISPAVWAQVTGATLSGTVTDASGAVVNEAQVTVKNQATGVATFVRTNLKGMYSVPNLLAGSYEVTACASGFATEVQAVINLTVGAQQVPNFTLEVGQTTQISDGYVVTIWQKEN